MPEERNAKDKRSEKQKRKFLESFFAREEPDEDYLPELRDQWGSMDLGERIKFIFGAVIGLALFIGGLILVFLIISGIVS